MKAEFINPFLQAASQVLESELGSPPIRGNVGLQRSAYTSNDVTAVVGVTGSVAGMVLRAASGAKMCAGRLAGSLSPGPKRWQ